MPSDELITRIHESPYRAVFAITGGGSAALSQLLEVAGASQTVLEAVVPYSESALIDFLGSRPDEFCTGRTARAMAMQCFLKARRLAKQEQCDSEDDQHLLGVACTASLATDRPKRGEHRAHIAIQHVGFTEAIQVSFEKGARSRKEEESFVAHVILERLALAADLTIEDATEHCVELIKSSRVNAPANWQRLLLGEADRIGASTENLETPRVVFPGAFNPAHNGHFEMAQIAADRLNCNVDFEISIENVDKPLLDYIEIKNRLAQFSDGQTVWLTRAPTFAEKSALFPNTTFVVGADTITRVANLKYYNDDEKQCDKAIATIRNNGCRFLVFGRVAKGRFRALDDLHLPASLHALCDEISGEMFRCDLSSTNVRRKAKG